MTAGNCNVEGLPVRATTRLDTLVGGYVINAGSLGTVSLYHTSNSAAVAIIWAGGKVLNHRSLDNIVIHRH